MTQNQLILAGVSVLLWVSAYFWFFHADLVRWLHMRAALRAEDRRVMCEHLERQARMVDELAQRYTLPEKRHPAHA